MNRSAAVLVILLTLLSPAWAQQQTSRGQQTQKSQQRSPAPRPEKPPRPARPVAPNIRNSEATIQRLRKAFRLSDDQVFQLRSLVNERNLELAQARESDGNAQSRRAEADSIQDRFQSDFRRILTPEQVERFDKQVLSKPGIFK